MSGQFEDPLANLIRFPVGFAEFDEGYPEGRSRACMKHWVGTAAGPSSWTLPAIPSEADHADLCAAALFDCSDDGGDPRGEEIAVSRLFFGSYNTAFKGSGTVAFYGQKTIAAFRGK